MSDQKMRTALEAIAAGKWPLNEPVIGWMQRIAREALWPDDRPIPEAELDAMAKGAADEVDL